MIPRYAAQGPAEIVLTIGVLAAHLSPPPQAGRRVGTAWAYGRRGCRTAYRGRRLPGLRAESGAEFQPAQRAAGCSSARDRESVPVAENPVHVFRSSTSSNREYIS